VSAQSYELSRELSERETLSVVSHAVAVPALTSQLSPSLVLAEDEAQALLAAAARSDVRRGGQFASGPAGVQVWSGPFDGSDDGPGSADMLGSVNWTYDIPVLHEATIYRAIVTAAGVHAGETTASILARVLALGGVPVERADLTRLTHPSPPARDPFRARS
jgi:hypothetical protein